MRLENISLRLRPRATYEATDLGVRLVQRNAGPVYRAWFAIVVPLMLLLLPLQTIAPWLPAVLIWWLKPLYDRLVLFVLSRSVFGEPTSVADVTAAWRICRRSPKSSTVLFPRTRPTTTWPRKTSTSSTRKTTTTARAAARR